MGSDLHFTLFEDFIRVSVKTETGRILNIQHFEFLACFEGREAGRKAGLVRGYWLLGQIWITGTMIVVSKRARFSWWKLIIFLSLPLTPSNEQTTHLRNRDRVDNTRHQCARSAGNTVRDE